MRIRVGAVANRGGARKGSVGSEVRNRDSSSYYGCVILFVGGPISQANGWVAQLAEQRTENPLQVPRGWLLPSHMSERKRTKTTTSDTDTVNVASTPV